MRLDADQLGRTTAESRPRRRACPLVGAAALRVADLGKARKTPAGCPQQASPAGNRLVRGSPGRVWARTSPCIGGLFLVSAVIPQRPICSNPTHDDGRPYHATPGIHTAHGMLCSAIGLPAAHSEGQSHDRAREQRPHLRLGRRGGGPRRLGSCASLRTESFPRPTRPGVRQVKGSIFCPGMSVGSFDFRCALITWSTLRPPRSMRACRTGRSTVTALASCWVGRAVIFFIRVPVPGRCGLVRDPRRAAGWR
jgi:hypothetical protein